MQINFQLLESLWNHCYGHDRLEIVRISNFTEMIFFLFLFLDKEDPGYLYTEREREREYIKILVSFNLYFYLLYLYSIIDNI